MQGGRGALEVATAANDAQALAAAHTASRCSPRWTETAARTISITCGRWTTRRRRGRPADDPRARQPRIPSRRGVRVHGGDHGARPGASPPTSDSRRSAAWRSNRGEALGRLGRFDEAVADLEAAKDLYRRLGSRMVAYPLANLGHIYRWRGQWARSRRIRGGHRECRGLGRSPGAAPALWLARVVVVTTWPRASRLADRALEITHGMHNVHVLVTAGLVARARPRPRVGLRSRERVAGAGPARSRRPRRVARSGHAGGTAARAGARAPRRGDRDLPRPRQPRRPGTGGVRARLSRATRRRAGGSRSGCGRWARVDTGRRCHCSSHRHGRDDRRPVPRPVPGAPRRGLIPSRPTVPQGPRPVQDPGRPARPSVPRDALMESLWPGQHPAPLGNRLSVLSTCARARPREAR